MPNVGRAAKPPAASGETGDCMGDGWQKGFAFGAFTALWTDNGNGGSTSCELTVGVCADAVTAISDAVTIGAAAKSRARNNARFLQRQSNVRLFLRPRMLHPQNGSVA